MLFLGSLKIMKWRQLFWIAFCVVELSGKASGSPTGTPTPTAPATETKGTSSTAATRAPEVPSSAKPTPETSAAAESLASSPTSPGLSSEQTSPQPSRAPTQPPDTPLEPDHMSRGVPTTESPATRPSTTADTPGSTPALTSSPATSGHPRVTAATTPLHTGRDSPKPITCHNVKEVSDTGAICLQLNESNTCIKLAKSEVDHDCMLLILVGERDPATDMLQESHWEKFGIKSLKRGSVRNHQDFSQKTLIALVTSGLMLAFLGLAGYFLMKRRSWSPAGERLAEDPYYTENGSQGNTMLMIPSQEQPELQEKPNLNGGTQENGTGQASSKNGHSARQHSPADTEM
ncbi:PREDICTED: hematopoietic progenitor cell antigen CD34 isoform X2 [Aptenodytes forsteri]|uniref:hematopoietic progenitor cell antigen CD34 isoform X2 n=1 Tax=Aptenodytes forsteri TaxID=9233 RepID=UPI0004F4367F|nr:PREDICTED: hematopoietic progenitor cell antigen CD34 isoform X2 [Aptenodytes forsteri]